MFFGNYLIDFFVFSSGRFGARSLPFLVQQAAAWRRKVKKRKSPEGVLLVRTGSINALVRYTIRVTAVFVVVFFAFCLRGSRERGEG